MLNTDDIKFYIEAPAENVEHRIDATVTLKIENGVTAGQILSYMNGGSFKSDVSRRWAAKYAPAHGISLSGGPYPVFKVPGDRTTELLGYAQNVTLVRWE